MESKSGPTSFGPFLEAMQRQKAAQAGVVREARRKVLVKLRDTGPEPVEELRKKVQMRFEEFAETVRGLKDAELIEMELKDSDEVVLLTDKGRRLADIDW